MTKRDACAGVYYQCINMLKMGSSSYLKREEKQFVFCLYATEWMLQKKVTARRESLSGEGRGVGLAERASYYVWPTAKNSPRVQI